MQRFRKFLFLRRQAKIPGICLLYSVLSVSLCEVNILFCKRAAKIILAALFVISPGEALAQEAGALHGGTVVEGSASIDEMSKEQARAFAFREAKRKAVMNYISSRLPPVVLEDRRDDLAKVLSRLDEWVISWQIMEETESEESVTLELMVRLDRAKLDSELKSTGVMPSRELPRVFVVVPGKAGDQEMKSIWDKSSGERPVFNACEAKVAEALWKYGFEVAEPETASPGLDPELIVSPQGEDEKEHVLELVMDKHGAGALVVGKAEAASAQGEAAGDSVEVRVRIAAVEAETREVLYSERIVKTTPARGILAGQKALETVCQQAGRQAVLALYKSRTALYMHGREREIELKVRGLMSYSHISELKNMVEEEGPGMTRVVFLRLAPHSISLLVSTTAKTESLEQWLDKAGVAGKTLWVVAKDEKTIEVEAR